MPLKVKLGLYVFLGILISVLAFGVKHYYTETVTLEKDKEVLEGKVKDLNEKVANLDKSKDVDNQAGANNTKDQQNAAGRQDAADRNADQQIADIKAKYEKLLAEAKKKAGKTPITTHGNPGASDPCDEVTTEDALLKARNDEIITVEINSLWEVYCVNISHDETACAKHQEEMKPPQQDHEVNREKSNEPSQ